MEVRVRVTRKRVATVVAAAALMATGGAIGVTTNGYADESGVYHGCVGTQSGQLRVLEPGDACRASETAIEWNRAGPQGPKGDKGDKGDIGPQGPPGTPHAGTLSGFEVVRHTVPIRERFGLALCPPGKKVIGGAAGPFPAIPAGELVLSIPREFIINGELREGWRAVYVVDDGVQTTVDLVTTAYCANVSS